MSNTIQKPGDPSIHSTTGSGPTAGPSSVGSDTIESLRAQLKTQQETLDRRNAREDQIRDLLAASTESLDKIEYTPETSQNIALDGSSIQPKALPRNLEIPPTVDSNRNNGPSKAQTTNIFKKFGQFAKSKVLTWRSVNKASADEDKTFGFKDKNISDTDRNLVNKTNEQPITNQRIKTPKFAQEDADKIFGPSTGESEKTSFEDFPWANIRSAINNREFEMIITQLAEHTGLTIDIELSIKSNGENDLKYSRKLKAIDENIIHSKKTTESVDRQDLMPQKISVSALSAIALIAIECDRVDMFNAMLSIQPTATIRSILVPEAADSVLTPDLIASIFLKASPDSTEASDAASDRQEALKQIIQYHFEKKSLEVFDDFGKRKKSYDYRLLGEHKTNNHQLYTDGYQFFYEILHILHSLQERPISARFLAFSNIDDIRTKMKPINITAANLLICLRSYAAERRVAHLDSHDKFDTGIGPGLGIFDASLKTTDDVIRSDASAAPRTTELNGLFTDQMAYCAKNSKNSAQNKAVENEFMLMEQQLKRKIAIGQWVPGLQELDTDGLNTLRTQNGLVYKKRMILAKDFQDILLPMSQHFPVE